MQHTHDTPRPYWRISTAITSQGDRVGPWVAKAFCSNRCPFLSITLIGRHAPELPVVKEPTVTCNAFLGYFNGEFLEGREECFLDTQRGTVTAAPFEAEMSRQKFVSLEARSAFGAKFPIEQNLVTREELARIGVLKVPTSNEEPAFDLPALTRTFDEALNVILPLKSTIIQETISQVLDALHLLREAIADEADEATS